MEVFNDELRLYLDKVRELDNDLQRTKQNILRVIAEIRKLIAREDARFVGNLYCKESLHKQNYEGHQFALDMSIKALKVSTSECMSLRLDSSGRTTICPTRQHQRVWHDCLQNNLLSSSMILRKFSNLVKNAIEEMAANESSSGFQLSCRNNQTFVSVLFKKDGQIVCKVDIRSVIEVECWPLELKNCMQRLPRNGLPSSNVVGPVPQDSHLYLIPGHPSDTNYYSVSWQYDFTKVMKELLCSGNDRTKDVLRILEGLISDLELPGFGRIHTINLMLQEFGNNGNDWHRKDLRERVKKIFGHLFRCVKSGTLRHYFLPEVNVLPSWNQEQVRHVLGKLDKFLENPDQIIAKLTRNESNQV